MNDTPYNFQSPSFHSSSYLPKMEANFMRDYVCCGITLDSLHELLQHYEEAHAGVPTQTMGRTPKDQQTYSDGRPQGVATAATLLARDSQSSDQMFQPQLSQSGSMQTSGLSQGLARDPLQSNHDMDDLDAMEMDDAPAPAVQSPSYQYQPQPQFGRQQSRGQSINTQSASAFQSQDLTSPTTPRPSENFSLSHNPTVSSVNTPTFGQTAGDGTMRNPGELDLNPNDITPRGSGDGFDFSGLNIGNGNGENLGTIDDPAKRLLSKQGFGGIKTGMGVNQFGQYNDLARRMRDQQMSQGINPGGFGFANEEIKPFKCPVIGCEKAYKNQNGLKYHKQVSRSTVLFMLLSAHGPASVSPTEVVSNN